MYDHQKKKRKKVTTNKVQFLKNHKATCRRLTVLSKTKLVKIIWNFSINNYLLVAYKLHWKKTNNSQEDFALIKDSNPSSDIVLIFVKKNNNLEEILETRKIFKKIRLICWVFLMFPVLKLITMKQLIFNWHIFINNAWDNVQSNYKLKWIGNTNWLNASIQSTKP